jgi:hypothetical protein
MEVKSVKVKYKELLSNGIEAVMTKTFRSWNEDGHYTVFYDDVSLDSAALFIPTINVISIELIRN